MTARRSPLVQCADVSKHFAGKRALDAVSLELFAGEPVALVGPNGAGKTTLLSILCGYIKPTSGTVQICGRVPGEHTLFGKLAALPQDARFDAAFNVGQQLILYARLQGFARNRALVEAQRVLELVNLSEAMHEKPQALSHGMGKRAAIAQALIGNPELVLLDEPTAGLDPANARTVRQIVSSLIDETTFIISSHNLQELEQLCKTVLYLERGQLSQPPVGDADQHQHLTLQMLHCDASALSEAIQALPGVLAVIEQQRNGFLIEYDEPSVEPLDQQVLSCLAAHGWQYRQLMRGKSLEERLFAGSPSSRSA